MALNKKALFDFLEEVDAQLDRPTQLVAVGGTALTLMDAKASTRDVDFTGPAADVARFRLVAKRLDPGFKVDTWTDGQVFLISLPGDYLERSVVARRFPHLEVRHAHPVDLVITKLGRYDERDQEDIESAVLKFHIRPEDVEARAAQASYAANEQVYKANLQHLLAQMRKRTA